MTAPSRKPQEFRKRLLYKRFPFGRRLSGICHLKDDRFI